MSLIVTTGNFVLFVIIFLITQIGTNLLKPFLMNYTAFYRKKPQLTAAIASLIEVMVTSNITFILGTWILFRNFYWKTFLAILAFVVIYEIVLNIIFIRKRLFYRDNFDDFIIQEKLLKDKWRGMFDGIQYVLLILIPIAFCFVIYYFLMDTTGLDHLQAMKNIALMILISTSVDDVVRFFFNFLFIFSTRITNQNRSVYFSYGTLTIYRVVFITFFSLQVSNIDLFADLCPVCTIEFYTMYPIIIGAFLFFGILFVSFSQGQNRQLDFQIENLRRTNEYINRIIRSEKKETLEGITKEISEDIEQIRKRMKDFADKPKNVPEDRFQINNMKLNIDLNIQKTALEDLKIIVEQNKEIDSETKDKLELFDLKNDVKMMKSISEKVTPIRIVIILSALTTFVGAIGLSFELLYETIQILLS